MRKTLLGVAAGVLLSVGVADLATAGHSDAPVPGPNGHNNHGLCTALFNGSSTGREHKAQAPPFEQLITTSGGELTDAWTWCNTGANNSKGVGGTPTNPNDSTETKPKDRRGQ